MAICAHAGMVDLRLSSLDSDILSEEELHKIGDDCRKNWVNTLPVLAKRTLAEIIFRELRSLDKTLAIAESCTGGLLSSHFTEIPFPKFFREVLFLPQRCQGANA